MYNFLVINESSKDELLKLGFYLVNSKTTIDGKTIWILGSDGLSFDINPTELEGVSPVRSFSLTF